jgi:hypothetical protein
LSNNFASKSTATANEFSLRPQVRKIREAVPGAVPVKILSNGWCVGCSETTGIGTISGKNDADIDQESREWLILPYKFKGLRKKLIILYT